MHPLRETWWRLFVNRTDGCLRHAGETWRHTSSPLTLADLNNALHARSPLGVDATDQQGFSRWLCLDADDADGREHLLKLARELNPTNSLFESSRRGAHLWWLCPPTPWIAVRETGLALLESVGITCEVFPKSAGRNAVRLPLTRHPKTGEIYPMVDPRTGEIRAVADLVRLTTAPLPQRDRPAQTAPIQRQWSSSNERFARLLTEVEQYTRMRQFAPERAIGRCPFHDDRHPSFSILGGFWRCWAGCGDGGIAAFRRQVEQRGWR